MTEKSNTEVMHNGALLLREREFCNIILLLTAASHFPLVYLNWK